MKRFIILAVVVLAVGAFFALGLGHYLSLEYLQASRERAIEQAHAGAGHRIDRVLRGVCARHGSVAAGRRRHDVGRRCDFRLGVGRVAGVVREFRRRDDRVPDLARSLLGAWVTRRFGQYLEPINRGFDSEGSFYLFSLRMVPVFPFFVVNLLMGLTRIGVAQFYVVSQIGMLAGTFVFVFAGTQLAEIHKLADVLSPGLMIALTLLGLFPLVAKRLLRRHRAATRAESKP